MLTITQSETTSNLRRRRPRFGARRVIWWPLLLIPLLVYAVYSIGTPWPDSAPVGINLETYGEPWDIQTLRRNLHRVGYELIVLEAAFVNGGERPLGLSGDSKALRVEVARGGGASTLYIYPDAVSLQAEWVDLSDEPRPRGGSIISGNYYVLDNVGVYEGDFSSSGLAEALEELAR